MTKNPLKAFILEAFVAGMVTVVGLILSPFIIGIPIFVIGVVLLLSTPVAAFYTKFGNCPYCNNRIVLIFSKKSVKCSKCKKRLILEDNQLQVVS